MSNEKLDQALEARAERMQAFTTQIARPLDQLTDNLRQMAHAYLQLETPEPKSWAAKSRAIVDALDPSVASQTSSGKKRLEDELLAALARVEAGGPGADRAEEHAMLKERVFSVQAQVDRCAWISKCKAVYETLGARHAQDCYGAE